jgi:predicted Zn-dependent peptidase
VAIQHTEVDGVPTLIASTAGRTHAGLVFRVGRADEPLARTGLTHLLEHLALSALGQTDYHYNGSTGATTTSFHTTGSPQDVTTFLHKVCDGLAALPIDRLETEKSIVRTEWASRSHGVNESMAMWRYGARGFGVLSYPEPGTHAITAEELLRWRETWFTRDNAVLWIAGEGVPAGLKLSLPSGRRMPLPAIVSALPVTPAYFAEGTQAIVADAVVRRSPAAAVYTSVLERVLYRDLRQDAGVSYTVNTDWDPRGDGFATITAAVDALPAKQSAALGGFIDALAALRHGHVDESDIAAYQTKMREGVRHPDAEASTLPGAAVDLLVGERVRDLQERMDDIAAVTADQVHAVAREAAATTLLRVPMGHDAQWAGFTQAPIVSTEKVTGMSYAGRSPNSPTLVVGVDGVTSVCGDNVVTVKYAEVAAMMTWPDGARQLMGDDGFVLSVEPTLTAIDPGALARIDGAVPDRLKVPMPARDPKNIPQPTSGKQAEAAAAGVRKTWTGGAITGLIASIAAAVLFLCFGGLMAFAQAVDDSGEDVALGWGMAIGSFACMAIALVPAAMLIWKRRKR